MKESAVPATIRVGHQGATESVVIELRAQVKKRQIVKVKQLQTSPGAAASKAFFQSLADRAGVRLLEIRGHSAVFADPKYKTERESRKRSRRTEPRPSASKEQE